MAVVTGITITKTGSYRWTIWTGWTCATLGLGLLILMDVGTSIPKFIFLNLVPGIGLGVLFPSLQFQLQAASTNEDMAFSVAMFTFFRSFGQALGVAIGGVIFQNDLTSRLKKYPHYVAQASELAKDAAQLVQTIKHTPEGADKLDLQTAYTDSLRTVYIFLCAIAGVALLTTFFIKAYDINVALETQQGLIEKKKEGAAAVEEGKEVP